MFRPQTLKLVNFLTHEESEFRFRQNQAILVSGRNLDTKSGQKSNGAGKSSLNEAISLALTGTTIRDCKSRELVRRGEDIAFVELTLFNSKTKLELTIQRQIFKKVSQSSTCRIVENGVEVTSCPDVNAYNAYILKLLEITKEDFFNFFVITKELYQPFLSSGDTKKKAIINRFSGAETVDKVDEFVKKDITEVESKITQLEKDIVQNDARKQEVYEQLNTLKLETSVEHINTEIQNKQGAIDGVVQVNKNLTEELKVTEQSITTTTETITKKSTEVKEKLDEKKLVDTEILTITNSLQPLETKLKNVNQEFKTEIDEITALDKQLETDLNQVKLKIRGKKEEITQLQNKLIGLITCPKCSHEFSLKDKELSIEEVKSMIVVQEGQLTTLEQEKLELDELLPEIEKQKQAVNNKIALRKEELNKEIHKSDNELSELRTLVRELDTEYTTLSSEETKLRNSLKLLEQKLQTDKNVIQNGLGLIKGLEESIKQLRENSQEEKLNELQTRFDKITKEVETTQQLLDQEKDKLTRTKGWLLNFKSFKSHLANQSILSIQDYTNFFLQSIGSNIQIQIEGYKTLSDGRIKEEIVTSVLRDGFNEGSYGTFSAGERGRIEICNILALQQLINLNCVNGGLDLLICDEILDSVDTLGLELIITSLQTLEQTIMVVSQNEINSLESLSVVIQKQNNISKIVEK